MRKTIMTLVLLFTAASLFAGSSLHDTDTIKLSLYARTSAPASCRSGVLTIYYNSTTGLQKSTNCTAWTALGSGLLTLANTWSAVNTFTANTAHAGGVLDIVGAGAPSGACVTGSMYRRTDGGSNTTLYICQAATWAAK